MNKIKQTQKYFNERLIPINIWFAIIVWILAVILLFFQYSHELLFCVIMLPICICILLLLCKMWEEFEKFVEELDTLIEQEVIKWLDENANNDIK